MCSDGCTARGLPLGLVFSKEAITDNIYPSKNILCQENTTFWPT